MLLVICSVAAARVLSPAAYGWPLSQLWDRPDIVGEVGAVEPDTETELCPPMAEAQSKGAAQPPISHRAGRVRPLDQSALTGSSGVGSVGFLGLLIIVVVAVVLFHLLQSQDRDRR
jgi:hypothetical protein